MVNCCPMCLGDEESVDHLFLNCNVARMIRRSAVDNFRCSWAFPKGIQELYQVWYPTIGLPKGKELWRLSFLAATTRKITPPLKDVKSAARHRGQTFEVRELINVA